METSLTGVGLGDDLKDRFDTNATGLQLVQQQKLYIARLLQLKPRVTLIKRALEGSRSQSDQEPFGAPPLACHALAALSSWEWCPAGA
jgi:hypothetical protein